MRDVYVIGAHTVKFGKYMDKSIKDLAAFTVLPCLKDAGLEKKRDPGAMVLRFDCGDMVRARTASGGRSPSGLLASKRYR